MNEGDMDCSSCRRTTSTDKSEVAGRNKKTMSVVHQPSESSQVLRGSPKKVCGTLNRYSMDQQSTMSMRLKRPSRQMREMSEQEWKGTNRD